MIKFFKGLLGSFTGLMCLTGFILVFTEKPAAPFIIITLLFGFLTYLLFKPSKKQELQSAPEIVRSNEHPTEYVESGNMIHGADNQEFQSKENVTMYKGKWYLQTWFISLLFCFWFLIIPFIVGLVLLALQIVENQRLKKMYGESNRLASYINHREKQLHDLEEEYTNKKTELIQEYDCLQENLESECNNKKIQINQDLNNLRELKSKLESELEKKKELIKHQLDDLHTEYDLLTKDILIEHYNMSLYDGMTSEECKNQLALLKNDVQELIKSSKAVNVFSSGSKKEINDNTKQIIRCFKTECDNVLYNVSVKNIDAMRNKITKSFESLNKIFKVDGVELTRAFLDYKLQELNLVYTYELKKEQEKEIQRAIKEQMIEEEKVRREIEKQKAKLEKDQQQCSGEIKKLTSYLQKTENDAEKQLYIDKIKELEEKIKSLESEKESVLEREANARAGYVYIISNIGSFGEGIYKIGMTRRLEPMDRIKELSSASVPFDFDVHAMIFSNDAPALENTLHKHYEANSVNKVNPRKEFFRIDIDDIETFVTENYNNTVQFTKIPVAQEYRQTLQLLNAE